MAVPPPERLDNLLGRFRRFFTKPQFESFRCVMFGMIVAGHNEHDVKSTRDAAGETKCQSSINRFFTSPSRELGNVMQHARKMAFSTMRHDDSVEFLVADDVVCKKYGIQSELVCYNHSTMLGTVLSHDYVTGFHLWLPVFTCAGMSVFQRLSGCTAARRDARRREYSSRQRKIQLCTEIIDGHRSEARKTVVLIDSWYTVTEVISRCEKRGYDWIGEMKSNRIVFYEGRKMHVTEPVALLGESGQFTDVIIDGEIYHAAKVTAYVPSLKENAAIVIDVKADTKDVHVLCTSLHEEDASTIIAYALKRAAIENFYRDAKQLGLGEYRFRKSEAALIHAHLVFLAYTLLEILRRRLFLYRITKAVPSMESAIMWVRKKARQMFIRYIYDKTKQGTPVRSLLLTIGKIDMVYA